MNCLHTTDEFIKFQTLKNVVSTKGFMSVCERCENLSTDTGHDNSLWMCLMCGNQACGRSKNGHALQHYQEDIAYSHLISVNTSNWKVWCYKCEKYVLSEKLDKLIQIIVFLKIQAKLYENLVKDFGDNKYIGEEVNPRLDFPLYLEFYNAKLIKEISHLREDIQKVGMDLEKEIKTSVKTMKTLFKKEKQIWKLEGVGFKLMFSLSAVFTVISCAIMARTYFILK